MVLYSKHQHLPPPSYLQVKTDPMVQAVSAVVDGPSRRALAGRVSFDARRPMLQLNPRPFFPGLLPKSRPSLRSCSSHTRPFAHLLITHSLAQTRLLGQRFLFFPFFFITCTFKRLWLLHSLSASPFYTHRRLHPLASTNEPSTPTAALIIPR